MTKFKLSLDNVFKSFGSKKVLQGVSLKIYQAESLVVIGGSGSGKSVMLKCILGLIEPDSGDIYLGSTNLSKASASTFEKARTQISMLFQSSALFGSLPVWENVTFRLLQEKKITQSDAKKLAVTQLAAVGLSKEVAFLYPSELSGGMQRRVALARAVVSVPKIILFDEPTAGLDPILAGRVNNLIRLQVKELGATAITITHNMASARHIADRIAMLYQGKIIWQGPVEEIDRSGNPYVDQFIHGRITGPIKLL